MLQLEVKRSVSSLQCLSGLEAGQRAAVVTYGKDLGCQSGMQFDVFLSTLVPQIFHDYGICSCLCREVC